MPSALDAIRALNTTAGGNCDTGVFLQQHPDIAPIVQEAMADPSIQGKAICRWLDQEHGIKLSFWSINRHRRGDCACE